MVLCICIPKLFFFEWSVEHDVMREESIPGESSLAFREGILKSDDLPMVQPHDGGGFGGRASRLAALVRATRAGGVRERVDLRGAGADGEGGVRDVRRDRARAGRCQPWLAPP